MNMISIDGSIKHDLIDWDSLEEIYTIGELERRVILYTLDWTYFTGRSKYVRGIEIELVNGIEPRHKVTYMGVFAYSY